MKFIPTLISSSLLSVMSASVIAQDLKGMSFYHQDWEMYCSNTGTCRAAGYQADSGSEVDPTSLLLTRQAGAKQALKAEFALGSFEHDRLPAQQLQNIHFYVNGRDLGAVRIDGREVPLMGTLSAAQVQALLQVAGKNAKIEFKNQHYHWQISDAGMTATLLKMDDFQRRVGTVGALIKTGQNSEAKVLSAVPPLQVQVVKTANTPYLTLTPKQAKYSSLYQTLITAQPKGDEVSEGFCEGIYQDGEVESQAIEVYKLSGQKVLVSTLCWRAAYNEGYGMWVMDASLKGPATFVTETASDFSEGRIHSAQKGRGIGDCWSIAEWVWNGQRFVQTQDRWTGMCKGLAAGGVWNLDKIEAVVQ